jgi:tetratricopeptide (TPR) repeat protein/DNA-binding CsgD family transcriptional regulator
MHHKKCGLSFYILFLLFSVSLSARAQTDIDTLLQSGNSNRVEAISDWYFNKARHYDSAKAISSFEQLLAKANQRKDAVGEAGALFFKGQYLAIKLHQETAGVALMKEGIHIAYDHSEELQWAIYNHHLGYFYFFGLKQYGTALSHMLPANEKFAKIGYTNVPDAGYDLYQLAFIYYHLANYEEALKYLQIARQFPVKERIQVYVVNTIGLCYRNLYRYDSALHYFAITNQLATRFKDTAWIGICSGNMGAILVKQKEYAKAKPYFENYYATSIQTKQPACISEALTALADISLAEGNAHGALAYLNDAQAVIDQVKKDQNFQVQDFLQEAYRYGIFAKTYEALHQSGRAFYYHGLADAVKDSLQRRYTLSGYQTVQQQLEAERHNGELKLVEKEKQNSVLKRNFIIAGILLLLVISLLAYNRLQLKRKRDNQLHGVALQHADELLHNYMDSLQQKTELLEQVKLEMESIKKLEGGITDAQVEYLTSLMQSTILTKEEWNNFQQLFEKVHTGFFHRVKTKYPDITPAEIRLLALTRLKLNSKAMASMLGVNLDTIKKTRQRLRKELQLSGDDSIELLVGRI